MEQGKMYLQDTQGRLIKVQTTHTKPRYESGHPLVFVVYAPWNHYHSKLFGDTVFLNGNVACGQKR